MSHIKSLTVSSLLLAAAAMAGAQNSPLTLSMSKTGKTVSPDMYGIFMEDINFAADGGLYAEMIKNRSFEYANRLQGWKATENFQIMDDGPFANNPHYLRLGPSSHPARYTAIENEGYFGMGVKGGEEYRFSFWARAPYGEKSVLSIELCDPASNGEQQAFTHDVISVDSAEWKKYTLTLKPRDSFKSCVLRIFLDTRTTVDLEHVSLFPSDTWMGHENGLRKDLAQALYDLHPGVFRFPGGCIVEGSDLETRYEWKKTVGPVENRPLNVSRWQSTFQYRFYPDYYQSFGLGFYEYFLLSEEIGAEPLPVLSCGLACQFQNDSQDAHQPVAEMQEYVQDALDLIEFANGGTDTKWGAVRAEMGHPEPFGLKYLAIGNEQWGQEYIDHLMPFLEPIRKQHPEILLVGSSGPYPEGKDFDFLWPKMRELKADLVDEHYYRPKEWMLTQGARYDSYDRKGPKVFAGEYACHIDGAKYNHFDAALHEAALMTGFERNADIVRLATYAPLFAHYDGWQWRPDMIWYDNATSVRTCSYYVQQLYSRYKGTDVLDLTLSGAPLTGAQGQQGIFASAVYDSAAGQVYVKIVNTSENDYTGCLSITGLKKKQSLTPAGSVTFSADDLSAENSRENPSRVVPVTSSENPLAEDGTFTVAAKSFKILIFDKQ